MGHKTFTENATSGTIELQPTYRILQATCKLHAEDKAVGLGKQAQQSHVSLTTIHFMAKTVLLQIPDSTSLLSAATAKHSVRKGAETCCYPADSRTKQKRQ
jgi:hypothetical protein